MPKTSNRTITARPPVSRGSGIAPKVVTVSSVQAKEETIEVPSVIQNAIVPRTMTAPSAHSRISSRLVNMPSSRRAWRRCSRATRWTPELLRSLVTGGMGSAGAGGAVSDLRSSVVVGLPGEDLMAPVQLFQQDDAGSL